MKVVQTSEDYFKCIFIPTGEGGGETPYKGPYGSECPRLGNEFRNILQLGDLDLLFIVDVKNVQKEFFEREKCKIVTKNTKNVCKRCMKKVSNNTLLNMHMLDMSKLKKG